MRVSRLVNRAEEIRAARGRTVVAACVMLACAFAVGLGGAILLSYWFSMWGPAC